MAAQEGVVSASEVQLVSSWEPLRYSVAAKDAPRYMLYPGVLGHYRVGGSPAQCLCSFFALHTESINAWTVVLSLVFAITASTWVCATGTPAIASYVIFACASVIHTPFSVGFHLFMPISIQVRIGVKGA